MIIYADTSFFVSLYLTDLHSGEARRRMDGHPLIWLLPLHRAEWAHAVSQHVFQRKISSRESQQLHDTFEFDRKLGLWTEADLPEDAFETCAQFARRYVPKFGVRTLDTLHVASAVELKAEHFWTFDSRQEKLARAVGLQTA